MHWNERSRDRRSSRPIRPDAPLEGRRLWEIGSWGNASDHIGRRWEELGKQAIARRLPSDARLRVGSEPLTLVTLTENEAVQARFQTLGLTNPDALLVGRLDGKLCVRALDFKWSLETASYRQISATALSELIDHPDSPLPDVIRESGFADEQREAAPRDGFFLAPDSRPNRQFLESPANRRQEFPIESEEVIFETVEGPAFFGPLPWWPQAVRLAELDRMGRSLETLEGAERYYRLGAGLGGAILRLNTSVFAPGPPPMDVAAAAEDLTRRAHLRTSLEVVEHLRQLLDQREQRLRRARDLTRCPYSFREMLGDLARHGVAVPDDDGEAARAERERWGRLHREVAVAHRAAVNAAGQELMDEGVSEAAALAALEKRRSEFEVRARAHGHRLIRQELAGGAS